MKAQIEVLQDGRIQKYQLLNEERPFTTQQILQKWQSDELFRSFFIKLLADAPFDAYFWDTSPLIKSVLERPFEFALQQYPHSISSS